ncbi:MAG: aromatic ring-hydroxylating dioxygenase subunit alpha [Alphaproteobacteria bacterium]|nr:aromatic ring-hydroxylating dioxygenase subunit alpha [Alphaproteobacteria bacterium]
MVERSTPQALRPELSGSHADASAAPVETLPAWTYDNGEFFRLERERLFMRTWQLICHVSEVKNPGDYATLDILGERAMVVRGKDGVIRGFVNVCRHRAARVVAGERGNCSRAIVCPYHGWTYGLDGKLKAVPAETSFPGLTKTKLGLEPLAVEVCHGFVFARFAGAGPSMAEVLAPYNDVLAAFRIEEMEPIGPVWWRELEVDWKNVMDNYLEGYHVPVGHPGLHRMLGTNYQVEVGTYGVARAFAELRDKESNNWSERAYQRLLPEVEHLPEALRWSWQYISWFPNTALNIYPDQIDFFQVIPERPGKCWIRAIPYGLKDDRRGMKAARFLNWRINNQVQVEDEQLVQDVQEGLKSRVYSVGYLSEKEVCLRQFHDMIRSHLPVAFTRTPPATGMVEAVDRAMATS